MEFFLGYISRVVSRNDREDPCLGAIEESQKKELTQIDHRLLLTCPLADG